MRAFDRTELGTLVAESLDGIEVFSASTAADGASLASVATAPTKWHETGELLDWADAEHGVAAEGWTADVNRPGIVGDLFT